MKNQEFSRNFRLIMKSANHAADYPHISSSFPAFKNRQSFKHQTNKHWQINPNEKKRKIISSGGKFALVKSVLRSAGCYQMQKTYEKILSSLASSSIRERRKFPKSRWKTFFNRFLITIIGFFCCVVLVSTKSFTWPTSSTSVVSSAHKSPIFIVH